MIVERYRNLVDSLDLSALKERSELLRKEIGMLSDQKNAAIAANISNAARTDFKQQLIDALVPNGISSESEIGNMWFSNGGLGGISLIINASKFIAVINSFLNELISKRQIELNQLDKQISRSSEIQLTQAKDVQTIEAAKAATSEAQLVQTKNTGYTVMIYGGIGLIAVVIVIIGIKYLKKKS